MTINRQDDGATAVSCDTDVRVGSIITLYKYSYRGRELWKDGRLQHFESKANDDGKEFAVTATATADGLHVRTNDGEHTAAAEALLTSYYAQPDARLANQTVPLLDADTGRDLEAKVAVPGRREVRGESGPDGAARPPDRQGRGDGPLVRRRQAAGARGVGRAGPSDGGGPEPRAPLREMAGGSVSRDASEASTQRFAPRRG